MHPAKLDRTVNARGTPQGWLAETKAKLAQGLRERFIPQHKLYGDEVVTATGLPKTKFYGIAKDIISSTLHTSGRNTILKAGEDISNIIAGFDKNAYEMFVRKIDIEDTLEDIARGKPRETGVDAKNSVAWREKVDVLLDSHYPEVKAGVSRYLRIMNEMQETFKAEGLLPEGYDRQWYYPHEVLDFVSKSGIRTKSFGGTRWGKTKATMERHGSRRDIDRNMIDVMGRYLADSYHMLATKKVVREVLQYYDVRNNPKLDPGGAPASLRADGQVPIGYRVYHENYGFMRARATSVAERLFFEMLDTGFMNDFAEKLYGISKTQMADVLQQAGMADEAMLAKKMGASQDWMKTVDGPEYYIPEELAETLIETITNANQRRLKSSPSQKFTQIWKSAVLNAAPLRYNLTNLIGDFERGIIQFGPGEMLNSERLMRVAKEVVDYYFHKRIQPLYERGMKYGVPSAGRTVTETMQTRVDPKMAELQYGKARGRTWAALNQAMRILPNTSSAREDFVRLVIMDINEQRLARGEPILYGATNKMTVDGILSAGEGEHSRAAAHIARKSLIDYGDMTPFEEDLRSGVLPFYAWMAGNAEFWTRGLFRASQGNTGAAGRAGAAQLAKGVLTVGTALTMMRMWNEMAMGDAEESLPEGIRRATHFIVPDFQHYVETGEFKPMIEEDEKGTPRVKTWVMRDAMDDFMTLMGLDQVVPDAFAVLRGTLPAMEAGRRLRERATFSEALGGSKVGSFIPGAGAARTVGNMAGPIPQTLMSGVLGKQLFPDPLNPKDIPPEGRGQAVINSLGLGATGLDRVYNGIEGGTSVMNPGTVMWDFPRQAGMRDVAPAKIYLDDVLRGTQSPLETMTQYEAHVLGKIQRLEGEIKDIQGRLGPLAGNVTNRQIPGEARDTQTQQMINRMQEKVKEIQGLAERLNVIRRTQRHSQRNHR